MIATAYIEITYQLVSLSTSCMHTSSTPEL
jgi:hypothetical protein